MRFILTTAALLFATLLSPAAHAEQAPAPDLRHVLLINYQGTGNNSFSQQEYADAKSCKNAIDAFLEMMPNVPTKKMYALKCVPYKVGN